MNPWFLGPYSKRLDDELQALEKAGYKFEVDLQHKACGRIVLNVDYPLDGNIHKLVVAYPDNYPYFPFDISSPSFPSGKHKNPYSGLLCLIKSPQTNWSVNDTLAGILGSQVAKITEAHKAPDDAEHLEAHEAAQVTGYFHYEHSSVLYTGDWDIPKSSKHGTLLIGVDPLNSAGDAMRGTVFEVRGEDGTTLAAIDDRLRSRHSTTNKARWVRLHTVPESDNPAHILAEAIKEWPSLAGPQFNHGPDVIGLLMPEEVQYKQYHESWVFLVRRKVKRQRGASEIRVSFVRSDRATQHSIQARVPRTVPLSEKTVLIVGLGSLGSIIAWQLARAGVKKLRLIDFDFVQIGNTPRWLLGWLAAGYSKAHVLRNYLQQQYPFIEVECIDHRIGGSMFSSPSSDLHVLQAGLDGTDLIIDATAEWCVSHYLSDLATEKGIAYLWATGTPGGWGGTIGRIVPGKTQGCWKCYQSRLFDQSIKTPNQEVTPDIQPAGCFHPTFTGAGFDMDHVSLAAVRLAVSTLCADKESGYPDFEWDVGVVDLWSEKGSPIAPEWHTYKLTKHTDCDCHD